MSRKKIEEVREGLAEYGIDESDVADAVAWAQGAIVPVTNRSTVRELTGVLAYPKFRLTADDRHEILGDYLPFAHNHTLTPGSRVDPSGPACSDPHDQIFVDLAIAAGADALVSGDQHILDMAEVLTMPVWSPAELKEALSRRTSRSM